MRFFSYRRLTVPAQQVTLLAEQEARALGQDHVGAEHVLLGLVREKRGLAARILAELGITPEEVRRLVPAGGGSHVGQPPFDAGAQKAMECAVLASEAMKHPWIGTEHLLLGVADGGVVFEELGSSGPAVREATLRAFEGDLR